MSRNDSEKAFVVMVGFRILLSREIEYFLQSFLCLEDANYQNGISLVKHFE